MKIFDISPLISEAIGVWPGDTPFQREVILDVDGGDPIGLSKVTSTLHLGAHVDAPNHYVPKAEGIGERSLHYYYGPCQVVDASTPSGERVRVSHLRDQKIKAPRVLIRTGSFPDPENWNSDFCSLSVELIEFLAKQNVLLVGIDTPSIDPQESKDLPSHKAIASYNMAILEGIVLTDIEDGLYTLSALPLNLKKADASPVRAVLIR